MEYFKYFLRNYKISNRLRNKNITHASYSSTKGIKALNIIHLLPEGVCSVIKKIYELNSTILNTKTTG